MTRPMPDTLRALSAAAALICLSAPALAGGQLAVGEVIPLSPPPGYEFRPLYTPPVMHSRWEPTDNTFGTVFREPLYTAPPGYAYRYVRGYTAVRLVDPALRPVRKVALRKQVSKRARTPACVTDLGYGHYYECR
jgi:hypothetical protein